MGCTGSTIARALSCQGWAWSVACGTLIHHAGRHELEPGAVGALLIAMVEAPQFAGLVAGARGAQRPPPCLAAADRSAVDLAAVTTPAQVEDRTAPAASCLSKSLVHCARASANAGR